MYRGLLVLLVIVHLAVVFLNFSAMIVIWFYAPWYIALPVFSFLFRLATVERECPLTIVENWLRDKLGMKRINTFIGHYIVKHCYRIRDYFK